MKFNKRQLLKLSDLGLDLAKGLFLATFAAPIISTQVTFLVSLKSAVLGIGLAFLALKILELEEINI